MVEGRSPCSSIISRALHRPSWLPVVTTMSVLAHTSCAGCHLVRHLGRAVLLLLEPPQVVEEAGVAGGGQVLQGRLQAPTLQHYGGSSTHLHIIMDSNCTFILVQVHSTLNKPISKFEFYQYSCLLLYKVKDYFLKAKMAF